MGAFEGWKCGHCLALNLPDKKLCKECGKERISKSDLDAKKEAMDREKREAQERANMLANETPQDRMKREAKERKAAREKKKQRALEKQQGKKRRKEKSKEKKKERVVEDKEILARYSDFLTQRSMLREKWKMEEGERLLK